MVMSTCKQNSSQGTKFMGKILEHPFSDPVTIFYESRLPERATPVGYGALIDAYALKVPMPRTLSAVGPRHKHYQEDGWHIYTPRHAPPASLEGHLTLSLIHISEPTR